jgi:hypothetical protein
MRIGKALVAISRALEWLGILWVVGCAGYALWVMEMDQRISDAISDAVPLVLAGGIGCMLAWLTARFIRGLAQKTV